MNTFRYAGRPRECAACSVWFYGSVLLASGSSVDLGDGNDTLGLYTDGGPPGTLAGTVILGGGNDWLGDGTLASTGSVDAGSGDDVVFLQSVAAGAVVQLGAGNDTLGGSGRYNGPAMVAGSVSAGDGDDSLFVQLSGTGSVDGGAGVDTLSLSGGANLLNTAQIANFEKFQLSSGTYTIDQSMLPMIFGAGSSATVQATASSLDLSGWTLANTVLIGTTNTQGTTFTVDNATAALNVRGGSGTDTLVAHGVTFTDTQLKQIFSASVENVTDDAGVHLVGVNSSGGAT